MFAVEVRDRIMIGHSLPDPFFGPAQNMHGATFVVDVAFLPREDDQAERGGGYRCGARYARGGVLKPLKYQNLDTLPQFKGILTTTEFLAHHIFEEMVKGGEIRRARRDGKA